MNGVSQLSVMVARPAVADRVKLTLHQSPWPQLRGLTASDVDGTIVLTGELPSYYLKQVAQVVASAVEGVRRLENQTIVTPLGIECRGSDWTIDRRVYA
jgi:hypothetical protein